jgi:ketosteroid isomerase-like protein
MEPNEEITEFLTAWTAAERNADTAFIDEHLTDDFVGVGPLGFTLTKADWRARHETGDLTYDAFDVDEVQARVYGDTAVVIARHQAVGAYRGNPIPQTVRATLVLVHDEGAWRLAGIHFSFIAGTPGAPPLPGQRPAQEGS